MTISESANYFGIGEKKLRQIIEYYDDGGFVLYNGSKYLIKRKKFESFLDELESL